MIKNCFPKLRLIATAVAVFGSYASFSPTAFAEEKEKTIGLAVANLQADFFNQIKQSVEREAKAKGVKVVTVDAKGDAATQVSQIQDLITRGVDALIYIPAGATAAEYPVKAAREAKIPVVAVDRNARMPLPTRSSRRIASRRREPSANMLARLPVGKETSPLSRPSRHNARTGPG
jgi:ABC-type sugar transport system substrate-binding protein